VSVFVVSAFGAETAKTTEKKAVTEKTTPDNLMAAKKVHAKWCKSVLDNMDHWKGAKKEFMVCPKCGNVVDKLPGPACPTCKEDTKKIIPVN